MTARPFEVTSFTVLDAQSEINTQIIESQIYDFCELSESEGTPAPGKKRLYFDSTEGRFIMVNENGLKFPIAYLSDTGTSPIASLTSSPNTSGDPSTEIISTWTLIPTASSYDFEFRESAGLGEFTAISLTTNTFLLTGLTPNTAYDIRVRAIINDVVGPYVTTTSFTLEANPILDATIAFVCLGNGAIEAAYGVVENGVEVRKLLTDGTQIVLDTSRTIVDGLATVIISQGEALLFNGGFGTCTAYDGSGNMYGMTSSVDIAESLFFTRDRNSPHEVFLYAFADCTATLSIPSGGVLGTVSLISGAVGSIPFSTTDGPFIVTNNVNAPMMGFIRSAASLGTPVDQSPIVNTGNTLIGIPSAEAWISTIETGIVTLTRSDNVTASFAINTSSYSPTGLGSGSLYTGPSALAEFSTSSGGTVTSVADSNGSKSTPWLRTCLLYTSPSPRDGLLSRMPSSA